jgi:hypothetical protein
MADVILDGDQVLVAKVETTYGVDATPTAAANAMRVKANIQAVVLETEEMNYDAGRPGAKGKLEKSRKATGSLDGYVAGSGTAIVPVALTPLMKSAGLKVVAGTTQVDITPADISEQDSCTLKFFRGKNRHDILGWRSDWELMLNVDSLPTLKFPNGQGLSSNPQAEASLQNAVLTAFKNPLPVDPTHFVVQSIFGETVAIASITVKGGNAIEYIPEANEVRITDRKTTISAMFREPLVADKDWYALINTYGAIAVQLGQDTVDEGRIWEVSCANAQLVSLSTSTRKGISYLQAEFDCVPLSRNSDIAMATR